MRSILFGLFFILFDITLNLGAMSFSILPDFVGYALMLRVLGGMAPYSVRFERLDTTVKYMTAYSAIYYFLQLVGYLPTMALPLQQLFALIDLVMRLYILRELFLGIRDIEDGRSLDLGSGRLLTQWKAILCCSLLTLLPGWLLLMLADPNGAAGSVLSVLVLAGMLGGLFFSIRLMIFFYQSQKQYNAAGLLP